MDRKTTEELNELSKKVFGASSRWRKLVEKGVAQPMERDREVMVPDNRGGLEKKVFTDRKTVLKRYTVDEIKELMVSMSAPPKHLLDNAVTSGPTISLENNGIPSGTPVTGSGIPEGTSVK